MYFENFKRVYYDFPIAVGDRPTTLIKVSDITRNVRFKIEFIKSLGVFETYKMNDSETIEMVSEKIYGTPDYHWILMILNERYDYIEDFALDSNRFHKYMVKKYGDRQVDTRFFIDSTGVITNGKAVLNIANVYDKDTDQYLIEDKIKIGSRISRKTAFGEYHAIVESINRETGDLGVLFISGNIVKGDAVTIFDRKTNDAGVVSDSILAITKVLTATVLPGYTSVSNYEYEYALNEDKRIIKIIPAGYMSQIINEFSEIIG